MIKWLFFKMMILSIIIISFYHPSDDEYKYYNFKEFYLSSELFNCVLITIVGIFLIIIFKVKEVGLAIWHLTNATWWSFGCDVLSGLFSTMPNLSNFYKIMDSNHLSKDKKHSLDAVYWSELFIHVPLSYLCFYLYLINSKKKYILETFLAGIQLMGTIAYYLPEILNKGQSWSKKHKITTIFNLGFGSIWIIFPIYILIKNI